MNYDSGELPSVGPEWIRPLFEKEIGELERISASLNIPMDILKEAFDHAKLEKLTDTDWGQLQNSDSKDSSWTIDEAVEWLSNRTLAGNNESRDVKSLIQGFDLGNRIPAPIVLLRKNNPPYLVAGNSRLLVARAQKITPTVLVLRSKEF